MYYWKGGSPSFFAIANYNYTLTETTNIKRWCKRLDSPWQVVI